MALSTRSKFIIQIGLTLIFFVCEFVTAQLTGSDTLLADAFHMLSDVIALILGLFCMELSKKSNPPEKFTFGYARAEVVGAFANSVILATLIFEIILEAFEKFIVGPNPIENVELLIIVGALGEAVDYLGLLDNWRRMVMLCDGSGMPRTMHTCTNAIININLDHGTARARSYYVVYQQTDKLPLQAIVAGRYVDKFELVAGRWRFSQRDYRMMEMIGNISEHLHHSKLIMAQQLTHS